ncbi:CRISPR system precrRNA processing endoribonuclease RAMP protein Cas6 [Candidatus Uabimicrobium sp. HlEnr_7]|uniref:CRISPR system precrRNA processing endoribonuclease RAMP protein Cas6 n=1 Tax=Candidatus Uabimicrobium helgolandensis TaxID=3095367 RepID=UPI0035592666
MPASMVLHVKPTDHCPATKVDGGIAITSLGKILYKYMKDMQVTSPESLIKNYTFSPLYLGERSPRIFNIDTKKGTLCWFRLSTLEEQVSNPLFNHLYQDIITNQIPALKTKEVDFEVVRAISTASSKHPWVNSQSLEDLLSENNKDDDEALIDFVSSTLFINNGKFTPLPIPELVYNDLGQRWNKILPQHKIDDSIISEIANNVVIVLFKNLCTSIQNISQETLRVGFVGKVRFRLIKKDPQLLRYFNLLSDISFYVGLGKDTNMGCGMVRRIPRSKWALQRDLLK